MLLENYQNIINDMQKNQFIPPQLVEYTKQAIYKQVGGLYIQALTEKSSSVINAIAAMISDATKATNLTPEELFNHSSFNIRDLDPTKISSFFAEVRSINYLFVEGFRNIRIIKANKEKSADFYAEKNSFKYVIEVTNSSHYASKGKWGHKDLVKFYLNKLIKEKKYEQLMLSCNKESCDKMVLVLVIDTEDKVALNSPKDYIEVLKETWERFNKVKNLHLCIVTGKITLGYGKDDVVYPFWDN